MSPTIMDPSNERAVFWVGDRHRNRFPFDQHSVLQQIDDRSRYNRLQTKNKRRPTTTRKKSHPTKLNYLTMRDEGTENTSQSSASFFSSKDDLEPIFSMDLDLCPSSSFTSIASSTTSAVNTSKFSSKYSTCAAPSPSASRGHHRSCAMVQDMPDVAVIAPQRPKPQQTRQQRRARNAAMTQDSFDSLLSQLGSDLTAVPL